MSCERYWREGIVLVEHGLDDPHRDRCEDCTHAHASRQELIDALPLIGAGDTGDPRWQDKVWQRLGEPRTRAPWRWQWQLSGLLAAACVIALWIGRDRPRTDDAPRPGEARPRIEIVQHDTTMRSLVTDAAHAAHVDDRLCVTVGNTSDVWIYRADGLVLRCQARTASPGCVPDAQGMVVDLLLSVPGRYRVFVIEAPGAIVPRGILDEDYATLESAGLSYEEHRIQVR